MKLDFDGDEIRPLIETVVTETIAKLEVEREKLTGKLACSEYEAAQLIGLTERQLAEERRRGRIQASAVVGRRIRYLKSDLIAYLLSRRWGETPTKTSEEAGTSG